MKWILLKKLSELTGYTPEAIRQKIHRGVLLYDVHYRKDPDGNIQINVEAYNAWVEGKRLELQQDQKAA